MPIKCPECKTTLMEQIAVVESHGRAPVYHYWCKLDGVYLRTTNHSNDIVQKPILLDKMKTDVEFKEDIQAFAKIVKRAGGIDAFTKKLEKAQKFLED